MRKIMLAATAIAGFAGLTAGIANAAEGPATAPLITPGLAVNFSGTAPEPGTVVVRLRTRLEVEMGYGNDTATITKNAAGVPTGNKQGGLAIQQFVRIYPGFDGKTNGGLEYGAGLEIRQNNAAQSNGGNNSNSATTNTLFFRRETGYVGTPTLGRVYFGQTDMATSRYMVGTFENFDIDGGFNGDTTYFNNSKTVLSWIFPEDGGMYTQGRVVYLSPSFSGFEFGASFEPNNATGQTQCPTNATASTCNTIQSVGAVSPATVPYQRRNTYDVGARYKGSFGPVAVAANVGYIGSGVVGTGAGIATTVTPAAAKAKGFSEIDAGLTASFSGLTVGGHFTGGTMNNDNSVLRTGQKNGTNFILGASYAFGTAIVGVQYLNEQNAGFTQSNADGSVANGNHMLHEQGVAVGGTLDYAPGAAVYISALYGTRHQSGWDIVNSTAGAHNNTTTERAIGIGNNFSF